MLTIRSGINRLLGREYVSLKKTDSIFVGYLNIPGALAISEIIYSGYMYNH
ncbi:hypothetical protein [Paenibacillus psychroresistens]|nr:hypothetical protein [Paenibacillus psychroresistens]